MAVCWRGVTKIKTIMTIRRLSIILLLLVICVCAGYAQDKTLYVNGKNFEGYVFQKEHSIWGIAPNENRYTLNKSDVFVAEQILRDSINSDYIKVQQNSYKRPPINRKTLKRYIRQYVGYINDSGEIIVWIMFVERQMAKDLNPALDIIAICDGGYNYWSVCINITRRKLFDMQINGNG